MILAVKMSLKDIGPVMFGGTPGIITHFRDKGLLAASKDCGRYYNISIIIKITIKHKHNNKNNNKI